MTDYSNRRKYLRTPLDAIVEMSHPSVGTIVTRAHDLSDGGISVDMRNNICPPTGTVLDVIIKRHTGTINSAPVKMQVCHVQPNGIAGLAFV